MPEDKFQQHTFRERLLTVELALEASKRDRDGLRQSIDELTMEIRQQFEGINGNPGIVTRLDRLEQTEKTRSKWFWLISTISLGSLISVIVEHFIHR